MKCFSSSISSLNKKHFPLFRSIEVSNASFFLSLSYDLINVNEIKSILCFVFFTRIRYFPKYIIVLKIAYDIALGLWLISSSQYLS